jgi:hypothetical protein
VSKKKLASIAKLFSSSKKTGQYDVKKYPKTLNTNEYFNEQDYEFKEKYNGKYKNDWFY